METGLLPGHLGTGERGQVPHGVPRGPGAVPHLGEQEGVTGSASFVLGTEL